MFRVLAFLLFIFTLNCHAGDFSKEANENPFLNGELNPKYEGELTGLGGTIIDHIVVKNNNVYKLDLKLDNIKPIWVTSFIKPQGKQKIEKGDRVVFKGYISLSSSLDTSGDLYSSINSKTLLMAIFVQNQGT